MSSSSTLTAPGVYTSTERQIVKEYNLKKDTKTNTHGNGRVSKRKSMVDMAIDTVKDNYKKATRQNSKKQGRLYHRDYARAPHPGYIDVNEMIFGLKMAHLACTDDTETRLATSSPNALMALEHLMKRDPGNEDAMERGSCKHNNDTDETRSLENPATMARLPLSVILQTRFQLTLDCWINESGIRKGRPVDTQGFIASNDDTIVLSYRFTTSIKDWLTNLTMTSSEWEPNVGEVVGHAGCCSSVHGKFTRYCTTKESKPRVHTAYYNNFIYTIPMIREHIITPLLKRDRKPTKIYIVGESLGAALSQIAFCFILEELYDTLKDSGSTNHRLISVTAGCPRVGDRKFRERIMAKMKQLKPLNRAVICRCVYNHDIVPHAPPNVLNFHHLDKMVYITKYGEHVLINPDMNSVFQKFGELQQIYATLFHTKKDEMTENVQGTYDRLSENFHVTYKKSKSILTTTIIGGGSDVLNASSTSISNNNNNEKEQAISTNTKRDDDNNPEEKEDDGKTIFEKFQAECESSLEAVHDHMPYWYITHLEKLRDKQRRLQRQQQQIAAAAWQVKKKNSCSGNGYGHDVSSLASYHPSQSSSADEWPSSTIDRQQ